MIDQSNFKGSWVIVFVFWQVLHLIRGPVGSEISLMVCSCKASMNSCNEIRIMDLWFRCKTWRWMGRSEALRLNITNLVWALEWLQYEDLQKRKSSDIMVDGQGCGHEALMALNIRLLKCGEVYCHQGSAMWASNIAAKGYQGKTSSALLEFCHRWVGCQHTNM